GAGGVTNCSWFLNTEKPRAISDTCCVGKLQPMTINKNVRASPSWPSGRIAFVQNGRSIFAIHERGLTFFDSATGDVKDRVALSGAQPRTLPRGPDGLGVLPFIDGQNVGRPDFGWGSEPPLPERFAGPPRWVRLSPDGRTLASTPGLRPGRRPGTADGLLP